MMYVWELILSVHGKESYCLSHVAVPDVDLEIRGGGGQSSRPLDRGGVGAVTPKNFWSPSGLTLV